MQFLKILFWALIAFVAAVFTFGNWKWVPIQLFGNLVAEINLPLLLLVTFLLGFLPTLIYQRAIHWRLRQRLTATERSLAELRATPAAMPPIEPVTSIDPVAVAAPAAPVVQPGVS